MKSFVSLGVVLLFHSFFCTVFAIGELVSTDARSFALGNLHALSRSYINPAWHSFQSNSQLGISVLNQFEMKELNTIHVYGSHPNKYLDAGLAFSHYGYEDYQINQIQAGLSKKILSGLSIGINLAYYQENSIWEEKANNQLSSDIGICYQLNESLEFAFLADHILHTFPDRLWNVHGGISYKATEGCFLLAETSYGASKRFNLSIGLEYELAKQFTLRAGAHTATKTPSFGIAYQWKRWKIDTGFALHPVLGVSSIIGLNYCF